METPHTTTDDSVETANAVATPWEPAFAGLAAGDYVVSIWPGWTTDTGALAYGPSITTTATPT